MAKSYLVQGDRGTEPSPSTFRSGIAVPAVLCVGAPTLLLRFPLAEQLDQLVVVQVDPPVRPFGEVDRVRIGREPEHWWCGSIGVRHDSRPPDFSAWIEEAAHHAEIAHVDVAAAVAGHARGDVGWYARGQVSG
jgi:hypothetical protein